jgi:hypothetical protein
VRASEREGEEEGASESAPSPADYNRGGAAPGGASRLLMFGPSVPLTPIRQCSLEWFR